MAETKSEEFVAGIVSCVICGVPISKQNIDFHRQRLCKNLEKVPEIELEIFEILKKVYETYAWLKRPRDPDDKRLKAKAFHIDNRFQRFFADILDYLYTAGEGWYKQGVQIGCKAGGSCWRIKMWLNKPDDVRFAGNFSNREITDVEADLMLEFKTWKNVIYYIDAVIKKQVELDLSKVLLEMVNLYVDLTQ